MGRITVIKSWAFSNVVYLVGYLGGGGGIVNTEHFSKSLKLTWLRRTIKGSFSWQFAFHQIIKKSLFISSFGSYYLQTYIKCTDNTFLRDIYVAYISLVDKITNKSYIENCKWTPMVQYPL